MRGGRRRVWAETNEGRKVRVRSLSRYALAARMKVDAAAPFLDLEEASTSRLVDRTTASRSAAPSQTQALLSTARDRREPLLLLAAPKDSTLTCRGTGFTSRRSAHKR